MKSKIIWREKFNDREGNPLCLYNVCFTFAGNHVAVAAGSIIYVYQAKDGVLIITLKNHKDTVLSLAYSFESKNFASGSADKQVIIWNTKYEGILKYSHSDSIRCLAFNSVTGQLASCTNNDFGIWSAEQKSVIKHKISSQINCCSWSRDGHYLALGTSAGYISIRLQTGEEKTRIEKHENKPAAIWGVQFLSSKTGDQQILASVDWSKVLNFFDLSGKKLTKEKALTFAPLSLEYFKNSDNLIITGINGEATIYTKDGVLIGSIYKDDHWIWSAKPSSDGNLVAISTHNGNLVIVELTFCTVHSLYKDRYVYRVNMSDVVIQNLTSEEKVRLKCKELIKKLAVYKNLLAIQLPTKTVIYETKNDHKSGEMDYRIKEKINRNFECTSMVVCSESLLFCQEHKLQNYNFKGTLEREWILDYSIRYLKVIGGPSGKESIFLGLKSGQVLQIFINNPFPVFIVKVANSVRCLDLSLKKIKLATVDEKFNLYVHDLESKNLIYQEKNVNSVAWNSKYENLICYSGMGNLTIKALDFDPHHQKLQGFVVDFSGSKVFCLHFNTMSIVEVSLSMIMYQFMDKNMFRKAYKVACLKVTDYDWNQLGHQSLESLQLEVARKAFIRTKNYLYLDLINNYLSTWKNRSKSSELLLLADVMAYKGRFSEAAKLYKQADSEVRAVSMYTDLGMYDLAKNLVKSGDERVKKKLVQDQASWVDFISEPRAAAEMHLSVGNTSKAIEIMGENGWIDMLTKTAKNVDRGDHQNLSLCAKYFHKLRQYFLAGEIYQKIGDFNNLAQVYVDAYQWEEALKLLDQYPNLKEIILLPYATWLAENDRFIEAQEAFHRAGNVQEALRVLNQLTSNAINENRFNDASYYCWILSKQCLELLDLVDLNDQHKLMIKFEQLQRKADIYYAYHNIHRYIEEPFTSFFPDALFNMARFLCNQIDNEHVPGVSKVSILYAFAKQARNLGAFKLGRTIYDILHEFNIPKRFQEAIEMGDVTIRGKAFNDAEDLLPLCYRCSTTNPLYNSKSNACKNCLQPFFVSFTNFDILPLVEFALEDDVNEEEAIEMIYSEKEKKKKMNEKSGNYHHHPNDADVWREEHGNEYQVLKLQESSYPSSSYHHHLSHHEQNDEEIFHDRVNLDAAGDDGNDDDDPFMEKLSSSMFLLQESDNDTCYEPIKVGKKMLKILKPADVVIVSWPKPLTTKFYRNLMPDLTILACEHCSRFFHADELELQLLQLGHCPFCRSAKKRIN